MGGSSLVKFGTVLLLIAFLGENVAARLAPDLAAVQSRLDELKSEIDGFEQAISGTHVSDDDFLRLSYRLEALRSEARQMQAELSPHLASLRKDLFDLGPEPEEGHPVEPQAIAQARNALKDSIAQVDGATRQVDLAVARVSRMMRLISELRRDRFAREILTRAPSPLSPNIWDGVFRPSTEGLERKSDSSDINQASSAFLDRLASALPTLGVTLILGVAAFLATRVGIVRAIRRKVDLRERFEGWQLVMGGVIFGAYVVPFSAVAAVFYFLAHADNLVPTAFTTFAGQAFSGFVLFISVGALADSVFRPFQNKWRLVRLEDRHARILCGLVWLAITVFFVDHLVLSAGVAVGASFEIAVVQSFTTSTVVALLIIASLRKALWYDSFSEETLSHRRVWPGLRVFALCICSAIPFAGALGYVSLARFALGQLILIGALLVAIWLFHRVAHGMLNLAFQKPAPTEDTESLIATGNLLKFWLGAAIDILMAVFAMAIVLPYWGIERLELREWLYSAFFGFKIGEITISLSDIAFAFAAFLIILIMTRIIQHVLSVRVLPNTNLDPGTRHSLGRVFGYGGIFLAGAVAVSMIGFDLSNIAIIAGALSVGIGFGLQSIVNNFVSGLILLIERPIRVGDWVVAGSDQGWVKNINVRSTEIETFDRSSVLIPNSELVTNRTTNWTLKDPHGRLIIPVGVSYDSDDKKVFEILMSCGSSHPQVLKTPPPEVLFTGFGDSSLNFELRVFVRDVSRRLTIGTQLRFAIREAFEKHGIEIPFPQRDLHITGAKADGAFARAEKSEPNMPDSPSFGRENEK